MRRTRALSLAGILVSLWAPSTTWAKAPKHKRTPARAPMLVLHPRFHLIAASTSRFVTDGRYVVVARPTQGPGNQTATLIDDQTGTRTVLTFPAQCGLGDIGGGWVLAPCLGLSGPPYQVYSIAAGTWAPVATGTDAFGEVAIGTDWIEEYHQTPAACSEHCLYAYTFRNIATGETRLLPAWRPGGTTIPNLNSPDLSARLCPPLRVPQGFPQDETPTDAAPDPFSFAGRFAVGEEWFMQRGLWQLRLLLESCGSRLHRVLVTGLSSSVNGFAVNRRAVIWEDAHRRIDGVFLPSLRRFTVRRSRGEPRPYAVFLTSRSMYLESGFGRVVAATSPSPPR